MKKLLALFLPLLLTVPVFATETTQPTTADAAPATAPNGSTVMLVVCIVLLVIGVLYLAFGLKKSKQV